MVGQLEAQAFSDPWRPTYGLLSESWCSTPRERRTHPTLVPRPSPDLDSSDHSPPPASGRRPTPLRLPGISPPQATSSVPHGLAAGHLQGSFISLFFSSFPSQHPCPPILPFRPRGPGPRLDWMDASVPGQDTRHGQYGTPTLRDCASSITKLGFRRGILHLVAQPCPQKHVFSLKENQDLDPIYCERRILADS